LFVVLLEKYLEPWKPVTRAAVIGWLIFYTLFFVYAAFDRSGFLFLDYVNLIIHEGGHFFFSWFGETATILGGTLGELVVPLLCALYFFGQREITAVTFCGVWFFENFLYLGTYMADARALSLALVGSGDHDWEVLFDRWGLLEQGQRIGGTMRALGWLGMLAAVAWLVWRAKCELARERIE
jgi:hypothetical protein